MALPSPPFVSPQTPSPPVPRTRVWGSAAPFVAGHGSRAWSDGPERPQQKVLPSRTACWGDPGSGAHFCSELPGVSGWARGLRPPGWFRSPVGTFLPRPDRGSGSPRAGRGQASASANSIRAPCIPQRKRALEVGVGPGHPGEASVSSPWGLQNLSPSSHPWAGHSRGPADQATPRCGGPKVQECPSLP